MAIKQETIEKIRESADILEVVSDFIDLKKSGQSYKALSPFTNEKTPSFFVTPSKGIYKCFSTGKGGDAVNFLMELEGLSYVEALKYLASKYNIDIEEEGESSGEDDRKDERDALFIVLNYAKKFFQNYLLEKDEGQSIGLPYFKERGFNEHIINKFELGYAPEQWEGLYKEALQNGYREDLLIKAGLVVDKEQEGKANKKYDRFRGRVMFPIHNLSGKVIGFGGRILKKDTNQPKYLNSPETEVYHKSKILYGVYFAKNTIRQQDNCYLVEGYTDVISLHQGGFENTVAASGTSLTEDQIKLLSRFSKNITVLFDGDRAGVDASFRSIDLILQQGMNVRVVMFPEGEDPDSYLQRVGSSAFEQYISEHTRDFIRFKIDHYLNKDQSNDPISRAELVRDVVNSIAAVPDAIQREMYFKECSQLLGVDEGTLITEFNKRKLQERKRDRNKALQDEEEAVKDHPAEQKGDEEVKPLPSYKEIIQGQERVIIRLLLNYGHFEVEESHRFYEYLLEQLEDTEFEAPLYQKMLDAFREILPNLEEQAPHEPFLHHEDKEIREATVNMLSEPYELSDNWAKNYIAVPQEEENLPKVVFYELLRLKWWKVKQMIADTREKLKNADSEEQVDALMDEFQRLKQAEKDIADYLGNVVSE